MTKVPKLPNDSQRLAIIGRTGTGKTQAAVWHLSRRNFNRMPWIVFDFKGDELINSINRAVHLSLSDPLPTKPGIYIVHPRPDQDEELEKYLWKIWERENIGVYVDEGYMMNRSGAFNTLLTQGRSKRIPMIVLSQRPVWLSVFVWSESDFFQIFHLSIASDAAKVREYTPIDLRSQKLEEFQSFYYDVKRDTVFKFQPVPSSEEILAAIDAKLKVTRKRI